MASLVRRGRFKHNPCSSPPASVDGTGATNCSAALQAWIDSLPNGSTLCFSGTYRIDQQINLWSRSDLTLTGGRFITDDPTGDGSTLGSPSVAARTRSHWDLRDSTNITIHDMVIRGPNTLADGSSASYVAALEGQMGFNLLGCYNVEIYNCNISYIYGDWFYHGLSADWCSGVNIHNNTLTRNGRQGVSYTAARNCTFHNNNCQLMARAFCDLEPNGAGFGCSNISLLDNAVGAHHLTFVAAGGVGPVDTVNILRNTVVGGTLWMIVLGSNGSRANWIIDSNTADTVFTTSGGYVMQLEKMVNVTLTNNTQDVSGGPPMSLGYFDQCIGVVNQGNTIIGGTYTRLDNASRYVRDCGNRLTAIAAFDQPATCVTNFGLATQYSGLTEWIDAYQATDTDLAVVPVLTDWSGNARHLTATGSGQPTFRANITGQQIRSYQFDGVDDFAIGASLLENIITTGSYTAFVVFTPSTISTSSANVYDNDAVIADSIGVFGVHLHSTGPKAQAYNWDGNADSIDTTITAAHRVLVMLRHDSGTIYMSVNGAAETTVATGNTTDLHNAFLLLGKNYSGSGYFAGVVNEVNIYNTVLTTPQILDRTTRLINDWKVLYVYGASDTFTRADGGIGTSESGSKVWEVTNHSTWSVVSNKAQLTTAWAAAGIQFAWLDAGLSDCTVSVDVDMALGGGLLFRYQDFSTSNFVVAGAGDGVLTLNKWIGQSAIAVATYTGLATSGVHQLEVVMLADNVKVYFDGVEKTSGGVSITNCQTSTNNGLMVYGVVAPSSTWDNFLVVP